MLFSQRSCNFLAALGCFVLIAVAYFYMEKYLYLNPCPLCYAQRIALGIIGVVFLFAAFLSRGRVMQVIYGVLLLALSAGGAALSIRHLYLQHAPKGYTANCGKDFYALVESTPFAEAVQTMLLGSGECGEIQWTMLGLSIPGWTLIAFIGLGVWGFFHNVFRR